MGNHSIRTLRIRGDEMTPSKQSLIDKILHLDGNGFDWKWVLRKDVCDAIRQHESNASRVKSYDLNATDNGDSMGCAGNDRTAVTPSDADGLIRRMRDALNLAIYVSPTMLDSIAEANQYLEGKNK